MKRILLYGLFVSVSLVAGGLTATAQEIVHNDGFEMTLPSFYAYYGTLQERGVDIRETSAPGLPSWCYWQVPADNLNGGLQQWVYVQNGETYDVSADICYHNC